MAIAPGIERSVAMHYSHGTLEAAILEALAAMGKDVAHLEPADLAPVDEFHVGGRAATAAFAAELGVEPGAHLLDIGAGLGGAARYFATELGCRVTGIDVTDDYVRVANALAKRVRLADRVAFRKASALALPFEAASFDGAYMLHVGMNIFDKDALFAEVRRVLKPGGVFGIYDIMRVGEGEVTLPVPWASNVTTSFLADEAIYRRLLERAGFAIEKTRNRRDFALKFFRDLRERFAASGPPPLGLHILMGPAAQRKYGNMTRAIEDGIIAPVEIVARAV
jgi:ubiquinone/menaquinone biosynthesis C-methylase UbiE